MDPGQPSKGGWKSAIFIIFVEMAERFAYNGVAGNLIIYLTTVMKQPVAVAAKNVNSYSALSAAALLVGAFFADSYLGRFITTLISTSIFLLGLILLTIAASSAIPAPIRKPIFFTALYISAVGDGGHKPCVQTFAADQFEEDTVAQREAKSSFFNWWYLGIVLGSFVSVIVVVYVEDNISWTIGYGACAVAVAVAQVIFVGGSRNYKKQRPVGSPFTRVAQVVVAAIRKRHINEKQCSHGVCWDEEDGIEFQKLRRTTQFKFLDKAMIIDEKDASTNTTNHWRLCSVSQVEEVKQLIRLVPIWMCTFAYAIILAQVHTFFIKQASTMNRSIGPKFQIPPASLQVIPGFSILLFVPFYDRYLVPTTRKLTKNPSCLNTLQRIGIGLALSILTIIIAALVEIRRIKVATEHGLLDNPKVIVPMSVWWLFPQFLIQGLSDVFTYVGMQELFYDQMPEAMRSMGSAFTNGALGVGAILSSVVIGLVQNITSKKGSPWLVNNLNRAHLQSFYWVLAVLCSFDLIIYVLVAKWFMWKKVEGQETATS